MTPSEIRSVVEKAAATTRRLKITGYRDSEGGVSNYFVQLIGSEGYRALVKASLQDIGSGKLKGSSDVERQALEELSTSWKKTLGGLHDMRNYKGGLVDLGRGWSSASDRPELTVIVNMLRLKKDVIKVAAVKEGARGSSDKTLAKKKFTEATALEMYIGRFNLGPDNVELVEVAS